MRRFANDEEVLALVRDFERCELGLAEFDHTSHLAVGLAYLLAESNVESAMARMRSNLQRFSAHHGKRGFHETITRFWLRQLEELRQANSGAPLWKLCNLAVDSLGNQALIYEYYDRERLLSDEARQSWVAPSKREIVASRPGPECRMPV